MPLVPPVTRARRPSSLMVFAIPCPPTFVRRSRSAAGSSCWSALPVDLAPNRLTGYIRVIVDAHLWRRPYTIRRSGCVSQLGPRRRKGDGMADERPGRMLLGVAVLHVVCCGLPLLIATGLAGGAVAGLRRSPLIAAAAGLIVLTAILIAARRRRVRLRDDATCCPKPHPPTHAASTDGPVPARTDGRAAELAGARSALQALED